MSEEKSTTSQVPRILLSLGCLILVVAGLKLAQSLFLPVLIAFFIASISYPITNFLRLLKIPRGLAVFFTVVAIFGFLIGLGFLVNLLVADLQTTIAEKYQAIFDAKWNETAAGIRMHFGEEAAGNLSANVKEFFNQDRLEGIIKGVLGVGYNLISATFIVLILVVFMLSEARMFQRRLKAVFEARGPDFQRLVTASRDIQRYLGIKTLISLATGALAWLLCYLMNLDFAPLWGILAFSLNYIPAIGSIIAGVPPVLLALLLHDWRVALVTAAGFLAINGFLGNFIEPMLMGRRFGISTLVVLLSVIFWGWLWGPAGMLMAVPLTMILKVAMDNNPDLRWISIAISKEKNMRPSESRILEKAGRGKAAEEENSDDMDSTTAVSQ